MIYESNTKAKMIVMIKIPYEHTYNLTGFFSMIIDYKINDHKQLRLQGLTG